MTRAVLSIGSNLGDRLAWLQSAVDGIGPAVLAASSVYESEPWGGVEQGPFLNAVLIVDDPERDARSWLHRAQELERCARRVRLQRWGPRTLDVDVICCYDSPGGTELLSGDEELTLPHPRAHQRAFVLRPWLQIDPQAHLTVSARRCPVAELLDGLDPAERAALRPTDLVLRC